MKSIKIRKRTIKGLVVAFLVFIFIYLALYPEDTELEIINNESREILQNFTENISHLEYPKFKNMPITYKINNLGGCDGVVINQTKTAFQIIQSKTFGIVNFSETEHNNPDIEVTCFDREKIIAESTECNNFSFSFFVSDIEAARKNVDPALYVVSYYPVEKSTNYTVYHICYVNQSKIGTVVDDETLGEGGIKEYDDNGYIKKSEVHILKSISYSYSEDKFVHHWSSCTKFPARETHEILHAFGFLHPKEGRYNSETYAAKDIMSPYLDCLAQTDINLEYIFCLNHIYGSDKKYSCNNVNMISFFECSEGTYPAKNGNSCCPKPNMRVIGGYCEDEPFTIIVPPL